MIVRARGWAFVALLLPGAALAGQDPSLEDLWSAAETGEARAIAERIADSEPDFAMLYDALRRGPTYSVSVPRGKLDKARTDETGRRYPYTLLVPESYDPARSYPAHIYLHGGVNRPEWEPGGGWWRDYERIAREDAFVVVPAAWAEAMWWSASQLDNLEAILDEVKQAYNVDENRVFLFGVSDGGTGVFYAGFRETTRWAGLLAFIGHPAVLSSPRLRVDAQMHVVNLVNKPMFVANGGRDRLYPSASIEPFIRLFERAGARIVYRPQPDAGHDMRWLPGEAARIDSFTAATVRDPLPDRIRWETETVARDHRAHWVQIDELGVVVGEHRFEDLNTLIPDSAPGGPVRAFPHPVPSGRIDVTREGNSVRVLTSGVRRFRLLISPERFDLGRSIVVTVNGYAAYDGMIQPDSRVLLRRAAEDADRSMLFAAELALDVSARSAGSSP